MIAKPEELVKWLFNQDHDKLFEVKEYKDKRSLSQNSYAWKLITQIGNILHKSKEEVYIQMLEDYGQSEIISVQSDINLNGYFKYIKPVGTGKIGDKDFTHYKIFKGSSEFDTKEMSIFIDGIIQECKQLGIETLTPDEIARLNLN